MPDVLQTWATLFPVRQTVASAKNRNGNPMPGRIALPAPFAPAVAVNRRVLRVVHLANYQYSIPARQVLTRLRLLPPLARGYQRRREFDVQVAPVPFARPHFSDTFGNDVLEIQHEVVREHLTLAVEAMVETHCAYTAEGRPLPTAIAPAEGEDSTRYLERTARTTPDSALESTAREIAAQTDWQKDPLMALVALGDRVHREMVFKSGSTQVDTPAMEAWANRRGVCQDYSHISLTLLRLCGIPARYVSGFVPGEGVMHAWIEALLPVPGQESDRRFWFAYDPTYNQWVNENYISVAVGRDYSDITPTSGTYYGGPNHLTYRNRVERVSKEILLL